MFGKAPHASQKENDDWRPIAHRVAPATLLLVEFLRKPFRPSTPGVDQSTELRSYVLVCSSQSDSVKQSAHICSTNQQTCQKSWDEIRMCDK